MLRVLRGWSNLHFGVALNIAFYFSYFLNELSQKIKLALQSPGTKNRSVMVGWYVKKNGT